MCVPSTSGQRPRAAAKSVTPKSVHGPDDRYWISVPTQWPWRTVCKVTAESADGEWTFSSSAVLVGARYALTAAHVVFDPDSGGWVRSARIVPAFDGTNEPYGAADATLLRTFTAYTQNLDPDYDIALIELDSGVGDRTGWLGVMSATDDQLRHATVNTGGFPEDKRRFYGVDFMWGANGRVASFTPDTITYAGALDTYEGQSGSGLWLDSSRTGAGVYVVGVHTQGDAVANYGVRISPSKLAFLKAWESGYLTPADLRIVAWATPFGGGFVTPASGSVTVTVANDGATPATATVAATVRYLSDGGSKYTHGLPSPLASTVISVDGNSAVTVELPVSIPDTAWTGPCALAVAVDGGVPEPDSANNVAVGPTMTIWSPTRPVDLGRKSADFLVPGGVRTYELSVGAVRRRLAIRHSGRRLQTIVRRPDGSTFVMGRSWNEPNPQTGTWTVYIQNPGSHFPTYWLLASLSKR